MPSDATIENHIAWARERTLAALSDAGVQALITTSPVNVQYLTGYRSYFHAMHVTNQAFAVLTAEGKCVLVIPSSDGDFVAMQEPHVDEVRTYGSFYFEAAHPESSPVSRAERNLAALGHQMTN